MSDGTLDAVSYEIGDWPRSVALGDLDGDGDLDLAVANWAWHLSSDDVSILYNTTRITFGQIHHLINQPIALVEAELNNDDFDDIVVTNYEGLYILQNNGDETFSLVNEEPIELGAMRTRSEPVAIVSDDFNEDSLQDLAVAIRSEDRICILYGRGDFTFSPDLEYYTVGAGPVDLAVGELDDPENGNVVTLVVANRDDSTLGFLYYYHDEPNGEFKEQQVSSIVGEPISIEIAVSVEPGNGNVVSVMGVTQNPDQLFVYYHSWVEDRPGKEHEPYADYYPAGTEPSDLVVVRESSEIDEAIVALTNVGDDTVMIFREMESGGFGLPEIIGVGLSPNSIDIGEFDLDQTTEENGRDRPAIPDLVVANSGEETICLILSDEGRGFEDPRFYHIRDMPSKLEATDFNNDGWTDVGIAGQEKISVWFNKTNCDDEDDDGFQDVRCGKNDCADTDPLVNPAMPEICDDDIDNDCDDLVDWADTECDCWDSDGDGFDDPACDGLDCDDEDSDTYPGADETCDGIDNDCDGDPGADEVDADGDSIRICDGDCDDLNPNVCPDDELCPDPTEDGIDQNCDGVDGQPGPCFFSTVLF